MSSIHDMGDLRINGSMNLDADVIVIGSGAGGATVAATALEHNLSVLVLEEGPYVPAAQASARFSDSLTKVWRNGGLTAGYGKPPVTYSEGRCVGGSTEINSAIFQRAPEQLLDEWATLYGIHDFGAEALNPYYDWATEVVNASLTPKPHGAPTDILANAAQHMGWEMKELERGQRECIGANLCSLVCPTEGKQSMAVTLLPRVIASGNRVLAGTKVHSLIIKNGRVEGVKAITYAEDGYRKKITAYGKKIFICGGAIQTPALLQAAGFKGRIGQTLRMHPTLKAFAIFDEIIDAQKSRLPLVAITEFMPDFRLGGSIFSPGTFGFALAEDWERRRPYAKQMRNSAIYYSMARAKGRGRVIAMPGGVAPIVKYNLAPEDWDNLGKGISKLGEALLSVGARHVFPSISGHPGWKSSDEARSAYSIALPQNRSQLMTIHLFGSCPIGENQMLCPADSFGRIRGVENLFIADASVIPEAPGVNPQATVMALARRNAIHSLSA